MRVTQAVTLALIGMLGCAGSGPGPMPGPQPPGLKAYRVALPRSGYLAVVDLLPGEPGVRIQPDTAATTPYPRAGVHFLVLPDRSAPPLLGSCITVVPDLVPQTNLPDAPGAGIQPLPTARRECAPGAPVSVPTGRPQLVLLLFADPVSSQALDRALATPTPHGTLAVTLNALGEALGQSRSPTSYPLSPVP
jgi:hypothetical protein